MFSSFAGTHLEAKIGLSQVKVPVETGSCSLFAVATSLALGIQPEEFQFDQFESRN